MLGNDFKIIQISTKAQTKDCIQKLRESEFFFASLVILSIPFPITKNSIN